MSSTIASEKKVAVRKAPAEKAKTYDEGYTTDGADGIAYTVKADKNGIKRWIKTSTKGASTKKEEPATESEEPATESDKNGIKRWIKSSTKVASTKKEEPATELEEPAKEKKKATKKKPVDPNKPPRVPTAYILFVQANMPAVKAATPNRPQTEYMKTVALMWNEHKETLVAAE